MHRTYKYSMEWGGEKRKKFTALYDLYLKCPNISTCFIKIQSYQKAKIKYQYISVVAYGKREG